MNENLAMMIRAYVERINNAETESELDKLVCETTADVIRLTVNQFTLDEKVQLLEDNINMLQIIGGYRK